MSRLGAFCQSGKGAFVQSRLGARGCGLRLGACESLSADGGVFAYVVDGSASPPNRLRIFNKADMALVADIAGVQYRGVAESGAEIVLGRSRDDGMANTWEIVRRQQANGAVIDRFESFGRWQVQHQAVVGETLGGDAGVPIAATFTGVLRVYRLSDGAADANAITTSTTRGWDFYDGSWFYSRLGNPDFVIRATSDGSAWVSDWGTSLAEPANISASALGLFVQHGESSSANVSKLDPATGSILATSSYAYLPDAASTGNGWPDMVATATGLVIVGTRRAVNASGDEFGIVWSLDPDDLSLQWVIDHPHPERSTGTAIVAACAHSDGAHLYVGMGAFAGAYSPYILKIDASDGSILASV